MKKKIKKLSNKFLKLFGYKFSRITCLNDESMQLFTLLNYLNVDTLFDIGSNEGQFVKSLRHAGYDNKVVSFEPLSAAYKKLVANSIADDQWYVHPRCAIGCHKANVEINISSNSVSSSILELCEVHKDNAPNSTFIGKESTNVVCLDSVASEYLKPNSRAFIKIDTQGYELDVLKGCKKTLDDTVGLTCELSLTELYKGQALWTEIVKFLESNDFYIWALQRGFSNAQTGQWFQMDGIFVNRKFL